MAKALKIAGAVVAVAGLAIITGGLAAGASLSFIMSAGFGVGSLTVGSLIAVSAVLNTAGSLLSPKPKAPAASEANANRLSVSMELRAFRKTVIGSTAMATDLRDQEWSADQSLLHRFIVSASHRCQAIRQIWFDDKLAWTVTGGVQAPYVGYLTVTPILEGSAANAINISERMGSSRRYTGLAYVYLRYKLTGNDKKVESPFASSIPSRVTIVGDGALFYDPRLDSTVPGGSGTMRAADQTTWAWDANACRNPALALLFYLLGWRIQNPTTGAWKLAIGKGIPAARIDLASFITAANLCDEPVTRADGTTEPRYRVDGIWSEGDSPGLVLDNIKASMNAVLDDADGKIRVTVLHNDLATPIGDLTMADVLGEFTWLQTPPLTDSINVIRGGYTDPSANSLYQLVDLPEVSIPSPDGIERAQTVNLPLVQSPGQGQRLFKLRLGRALYGGTFTAIFQATAWKFQKGDVIRFTWLPLGWDKKLFRIADVATQVDGTVPMMLREEHPDIYLAYSNEAAAIKAAAPTTYDPSLWPLIQGISDAGDTAKWSGIADDNGKRPDDNATNTRNPSSLIGDRTVTDVLGSIDVNVDAILAQALRQDDLLQVFDLRTMVEGQPVAAKFLAFRTQATDPVNGFASASDFAGVFAKAKDGTGYTMNLQAVKAGNATFADVLSSYNTSLGNLGAGMSDLQTITGTLSQNLSQVGALAGNTSAKVTQLMQAFASDSDGVAGFVMAASVDANGLRYITGISGIAGARGNELNFLSENFNFVSTAGGDRLRLLSYNAALKRWEFSAEVYARRVVADSIQAGDIKSAAVTKTRYAIMGGDVSVSRGATSNVVQIAFVKDDNDSDLKVQFFGMFWSPDDLQFAGSFVVDNNTAYPAGSVNIILDSKDSQGRMPITPFSYLSGIPAGNHTITFQVTNTETDPLDLTIKAGSAIEVIELKKAAV